MTRECPDCGTKMKFLEDQQKFFCKNCNLLMSEDDFTRVRGQSEYKGHIPVGCAACGGPYPKCKTSCNLFDD